jgi:hypothetical protein
MISLMIEIMTTSFCISKIIWTYFKCHCCLGESARQQTFDLPKGWRTTTRGYGGRVYICPLCNEAGFKYCLEGVVRELSRR